MPAKSIFFTQENYLFISEHLIGNNWSKTVNDIIDAYRTKSQVIESILDKNLYQKVVEYLQRENERRAKNKSNALSFSEFLNSAVKEKLERELARELFL